jgi:hypothetical protein
MPGLKLGFQVNKPPVPYGDPELQQKYIQKVGIFW